MTSRKRTAMTADEHRALAEHLAAAETALDRAAEAVQGRPGISGPRVIDRLIRAHRAIDEVRLELETVYVRTHGAPCACYAGREASGTGSGEPRTGGLIASPLYLEHSKSGFKRN